MDSGLAGKTVLVSGAASGIGAAAARRFVTEGAQVVGLDRDPSGLAELSHALPGVQTVRCDLSSAASVQAAVDEVLGRTGRVDVLVNNAGVGFVGDVVHTTLEEWDQSFAVNVRAPFLLCRALIPSMVTQGGGVIVNVASAAALSAVRDRAAYIATKGAVIALTKSITLDFGAQGIRANAVAPGTVATPWIDRVTRAQPDPAAARRTMEQRQLIGRLGEPSEVADAIVYLASARASFQHGSTLVVDGGFSAG